jgi:hypothetical protein
MTLSSGTGYSLSSLGSGVSCLVWWKECYVEQRRGKAAVWKGPFLDIWGVPTYITDLINAWKMEHIKIHVQFIFSVNKFNICDLWFSQQH